ncbi:hypothetical protein Axi01nite_26480 [Actinoplanes xinjiangensis]|nr:hypothetical protein Axi01nite_26480 [Actinoplanes xinjiangensis]
MAWFPTPVVVCAWALVRPGTVAGLRVSIGAVLSTFAVGADGADAGVVVLMDGVALGGVALCGPDPGTAARPVARPETGAEVASLLAACWWAGFGGSSPRSATVLAGGMKS